jgi:hypothetical protein
MTLPLDFVIPDGWTAVDPGDSGAVFVAVHPVPGEEVVPNITGSVQQRTRRRSTPSPPKPSNACPARWPGSKC